MKKQLLLYVFLLIPFVANSQITITYNPSDEIFINPERGFYTQVTTYDAQSPLTLSTLNYIKSQGQSLILRMYYLKSFRNSSLNSTILNMINNDFNLLRQAGMKAIVRFAYSDNIGQPDAPLNIVLNHIDQLKPILMSNSDVIFVMQAGFIGAWGEWHSSTNGLDSLKHMRTILFKLLDALPSTRMVQVRTPRYKQDIFYNYNPIPFDSAFTETYYTRTGHHNDCFLASWDDWGTYTDTTREKRYLNQDCLYVPMGGETCNPSSFSVCGNAVYQMRRLRWTYINSGYHPSVLNSWITGNCMNEIKRNLGYRFQLLQGTYSDSLKPGDAFNFSLSLTNVGYANLYNPRDVEVILVNPDSNKKYFCKLPVDARLWQPLDTVQLDFTIGIPQEMPVGNYKIYLNLPDPDSRLHFRPEYSIRFANTNVWESSTGYNKLNATLNINHNANGVPYNGDLFFQPLSTTSVEEKNDEINKNYLPLQLDIKAYPNPFNNSTRIVFKVNEDSYVKLKLYNIVGQLVQELINDYRLKGQYEVTLSSNNLSSGVYYCVLSNDKSNIVSKLIVMK